MQKSIVVGAIVFACAGHVDAARFQTWSDGGIVWVQSDDAIKNLGEYLAPRWTNGMSLDMANERMGPFWRLATFEEMRPLFAESGFPFPETESAVKVEVEQTVMDEFRELFNESGDLWGIYGSVPDSTVLGRMGIVNDRFEIDPAFLDLSGGAASQGFWMVDDIREPRDQRPIDTDSVYDLPCAPREEFFNRWCGQPLLVIDGEGAPTRLTFTEPGDLGFELYEADGLVGVSVEGNSTFEMESGNIATWLNRNAMILVRDNGSVAVRDGRVSGWGSAIAAFDNATVHVSGGEMWSKDDSFSTQAILLNDESLGVITGGKVLGTQATTGIRVTDNSRLRFDGGVVEVVVMEDNSEAEILGGELGMFGPDSTPPTLSVGNEAKATLQGGEFEGTGSPGTATIRTTEGGVVDIFGGTFQRGDPIVRVRDDSVINLHGGSWPRLSALEEFDAELDVQDRGTLNVFGVGLSLTDAGRGIQQLQGTLSDGAPIDIPVSGNVVLHEVVPLQSGDTNQDLSFDQLDIVQVLQGAKYLTGEPATWGQGDWNGAPGGNASFPPAGNGFFDQTDIVAALSAGVYLKGPYAAVSPDGVQGDQQTSVGYHAATGEVWVDAPAGAELTSINIDSAAAIFTGSAAANLGGSFDNDADDNIFKATFGSSFGSLSFGNVAQTGLSESIVRNDLTVIGSLAGGGDLGVVDLIYVPEPSSLVLLAFAAAGLFGWGRLGVSRTPMTIACRGTKNLWENN